MKINISDFIDLDKCITADHFAYSQNLLDYLGKNLQSWLAQILKEYGVEDAPLSHSYLPDSATVQGPVYIEENVKVEPGAFIQGPCFIGSGTEVRHTAYIRGQTYIGPDCVVGHATEVKGAVFFPGAKAGHFAYVGDSILGQGVNLGAGTKLANLKLKGNEVQFKDPATGTLVSSGLRKFGAILGDDVQTGCNAVLSPGSLLMPRTAVMPCAHFHGTLTKGIGR